MLWCLPFQDHGFFLDDGKETSESQYELYRRTLAHDINRHAAVVLEGRVLGGCFLKCHLY